MSDDSEEYRRGLIEGRIFALEHRADKAEAWQEGTGTRLTALEKSVFGMAGVLVFVTVWPSIKDFLA